MIDAEMLIDLVRQYPELYNSNSQNYNDSAHKDKLWIQIGKELHSTGSACKSRWISLRDQLRKAWRKKLKNGKASTKYINWRYEDSMAFVIPFFKEKRRKDEKLYEEEDSNDGGDESTFSKNNWMDDTTEMVPEIESPIPKRRKFIKAEPCRKVSLPSSFNINKTTPCKKESDTSILMKYLLANKKCETVATPSSAAHPIDLFFNGLAATVKNFSPEHQHLAKSKIFAIVSELEWAELENQKKNYEDAQSNSSSSPPPQPYKSSTKSFGQPLSSQNS